MIIKGHNPAGDLKLVSIGIFRKNTILPIISWAIGILAVFSGGVFITVRHTPPVPGNVIPGTGLCYPVFAFYKSRPLKGIYKNMVAVPIKITPGAKGESGVK